MLFSQFSRPIIFGHRGACAHAPENTLASFRLAVEEGADFIELDAKLSKDQQVMVIHDPTVDRTTNGKGKVNELTLTDLKTLDAGSHFDSKFAGEKLPTLDEVFKAVGKQIYVNVELTNYSSKNDALIPLVAEVVKANQMEDRVIFSSFLPKNLAEMRKLIPQAPMAILCLSGLAGLLSRSFLCLGVSPKIVHPYLADTSAALVKREHKRGRRVHVWTVNEETDMERLLKMGVDGIFTDDPGKANKILTRR
jgi:glycerophosphoryl diester phosphodiesterase